LEGDLIEISLSQASIVDINNSQGGLFAIGVSLDSLRMPNNELEAARFGINVTSWTHQLVVNVIPIPAAVWLFGSALAGLGWLRRKQTV
jgi:hypothetical protein